MGRKFPRAKDDYVVLQGKVWNSLCDEVERIGKLSVAPPLSMSDTYGGPIITLADNRETIFARLGSTVTVSGTNTARRWTQVVPATNGTFVDLDGGLTSDDTNDKDLAVADPDNASTGDVVLLRKGFDPDSGERTWGFQSGGSSGFSFLPVLCTGTVSAGVYIGKLTFPYTNVASLNSGQTISTALTPKPELNSEEVFLGNWNEFDFGGTNTATGEVLRVGSMYMASYYSSTNHTARAALYMTQGADGLLCS